MIMIKINKALGILLVFCLLFTACSPAFDVAGEPVPDDPTQKYATPNQFLPITLPTQNGKTCEAVVKVEITYDPDNAEELMQEVMNDEVNVIDQSPGWEADKMRIVKIKVLVMPWGDSDFTTDFPGFTLCFGGYMDGEGNGGGAVGPVKNPVFPDQPKHKDDEPIQYTKLFRVYSAGSTADPGDRWCPFAFYYTPAVLIESDKPYFETGAYGVLPKEEYATDDFEYVVVLLAEDYIRSAMDITFSDIPTEGKYLWKIM